MYIQNNTAKQYVFEYIDSISPSSLLDFACGTCSPWKEYLSKNSDVNYYGLDYNKDSIEKAHTLFPERKNKILLQDGQKTITLEETKFDVVNTFSSLEHVVNRDLFIKNMISYVKDDGTLIINYDSGHFRSGKIKDFILNHVSVFLAYFGVQKYYTKYVQEEEILKILKKYNVEIVEKKYFNILSLKGIHKTITHESLLNGWYQYELELNTFPDKKFLEKIFTSTVIIGKKGKL